MLDQNYVEVVDDHLAREEHDRLQAFSESDRNAVRTRQRPGWRRCRQDVGRDDSDHTGQYRSLHAEAEADEDKRAAQSHHAFQHEVHGEGTDGVYSLDVTPPHSQGNVEGGSQREQRNQHWIRQVQVSHDCPIKQEQQESNRDTRDPATEMQSVKDCGFLVQGFVAGNVLRADDLKRERDRGRQHQQRVDSGGMCETRGSQKAGGHDVINQVRNSHQSGPG